MFISSVFILTKTWKEPRHPSFGECIIKCGYSYNEIVLSNKKKQTTDTRTVINLKTLFWEKVALHKGMYSTYFH